MSIAITTIGKNIEDKADTSIVEAIKDQLIYNSNSNSKFNDKKQPTATKKERKRSKIKQYWMNKKELKS
jgi:hypothetical protein